ncbi:phage tail tape measure protein, partial [uncultured Halomonas sp.]|uniref:phage tail tape measure protein n=1 Tax=uncultured Halomonas sp. TaxID=173971 RepID=UPI00261C7895
MDAYSKLGVELDIRFNQEFTQVIESLKTALENIKVDKLLDRLKKVEERMSGVGKASEKVISSKVTEEVRKRLADIGLQLDENVKKQIRINGEVQKTVAGFNKIGRAAVETAKYQDRFNRAMTKSQFDLQYQKDLIAAYATNDRINKQLTRERVADYRRMFNELRAQERAWNKYVQDEAKSTAANLRAVDAQRVAQATRDRAQLQSFYAGLFKSVDEGTAVGYRRSDMSRMPGAYSKPLGELPQATKSVDPLARAFDLLHARVQRVGAGAATMQRDLTRALAAAGHDVSKLDRKTHGLVKMFLARYKLTIDVNGAVTEIGKADKAGKGLNFTLGEMAKSLAKFYLVRQSMFAVTNSIRGAVREAITLNQTLHQAAGVANATAEEFKMMERTVLEVARTSKHSAADVAKSMQILAQAGVSAKVLPTATAVVDRVAMGAGASTEEASRIFTTSMNVWKLKAEDATRVTSTLAAALANSRLQVGELATSFNYLANQSALMGLSVEQ